VKAIIINVPSAFVAGWALCLGIVGSGMAASNTPISAERAAGIAATGPTVVETLIFNSPFEVKQIRVRTAGTSLTVSVQDCCIAGDQWITRTYCLHNRSVWDVRGKGRGTTTAFTGATQVYKNGSRPIDCLTEVRYGGGVDLFPSGMYVEFSGSGNVQVTTTIQKTVVPLPSQ
jgi:hypothetical protein